MAKRREGKSRLWSSGVVFMALIVGLALAGVAFGHWTKRISVHADVTTGVMHAAFVPDSLGTDDDGIPNNFGPGPSGDPFDDGGGTLYDHWGPDSSNDRAGSLLLGGDILGRYDKDVGGCWSSLEDEDQEWFTYIENGYPSYYCSSYAELFHDGTVPMKVQYISITPGGMAATYPDHIEVGTLGVSTENSILEELACGYQLDPGETIAAILSMHVTNDAFQNSSYSAWVDIQWVNYNEWSAAACETGVPDNTGIPPVTTP